MNIIRRRMNIIRRRMNIIKRRMNAIRTIILLLVVFSQSANGEKGDSSRHVSMGLQAHYGFIIPHSRSIRDISHTNPVGIEISRNVLHTSLNKYQVFNSFLITGYEARYFNYQNPEILGGVFDFSLFAEPVIRHGNKSLFTIRGGAGFSYHTKVYDEEKNPLNMFFGSKISFPIFVDFRFKYRVGDGTFLTFSACYNHISNGGIKQPNKGMNFPTLALGLEHSRYKAPVLRNISPSTLIGIKPASFIMIQALTSVKVVGGLNGIPEKPAFIYGVYSRFVKPLGAYYSINAGAEFIVDGFIKETILRENRSIDHRRFAITAGQDFMLGKVLFTQYMGFYLYSPYKAPDPVYQKYELAYRLHDKFTVGVYLKAHLQVAELMGVNMSWVIQKKKW